MMGADPSVVWVDADGKIVEQSAKAIEVPGTVGVLYWRTNNLPNELLGLSDMSAAIDWLPALEEFHWGQMEAAVTLSKIIGDVEVSGVKAQGDVDDVAARLKKLAGYAEFYVHSEREKPTFAMQDSRAADAADRDRMHGNFATTSLGFPPPLMRGDMGEGTRAVAAVANDPAYLTVEARIGEKATIGYDACKMQIDQAVIAGALRGEAGGRGLPDEAADRPKKRGPRRRAGPRGPRARARARRGAALAGLRARSGDFRPGAPGGRGPRHRSGRRQGAPRGRDRQGRGRRGP